VLPQRRMTSSNPTWREMGRARKWPALNSAGGPPRPPGGGAVSGGERGVQGDSGGCPPIPGGARTPGCGPFSPSSRRIWPKLPLSWCSGRRFRPGLGAGCPRAAPVPHRGRPQASRTFSSWPGCANDFLPAILDSGGLHGLAAVGARCPPSGRLGMDSRGVRPLDRRQCNPGGSRGLIHKAPGGSGFPPPPGRWRSHQRRHSGREARGLPPKGARRAICLPTGEA
jgi:hypothetical protein